MTPDNTLAEVREALDKAIKGFQAFVVYEDSPCDECGLNPAAATPFCNGHIDNLEEALAKLDAMIEAHGWKPIETAPKDGSVLLLYQPINKSIHDPPIAQYFEYSVCRWENGVWRIENEYCGDISTINAPTHWMPLPKPPTQGDGR